MDNAVPSLLAQLDCSACGRRHDHERLAGVCTMCGSPLLARYRVPEGQPVVAPPDVAGRPHSLWRFEELLPAIAPGERITLGEGATPLLRVERLESVAGHAPIYLKEEGLNPTLSFKARGMAMAVSAARTLGATHLAVPSAGNAGGALAAYAARAGLRALVVLPEDTPPAFAEEARRHGAEVELVPGLIGDAARRVASRAGEGWFDLSTFKEPYRLEGKKTLGFEIVEDLGFRYPAWIVYPTGGGTGLVGMWKAFAEMESLGWITGRRPRMVTVQSEGCAPIVEAFTSGAERAVRPEHPMTAAYGLRVPQPFADRLILAALRESDGDVVAVSEQAIFEGAAELARLAGIDAGPEGGAAWAGVRELLRRGRIRPDESVVFVNTGAGIKYR